MSRRAPRTARVAGATRRLAPLLLTVAAAPLALGSCGGGPELPPPFGVGGDFDLTADDGQRWSLKEVRGHPVVLFFGFTRCPDICPSTLAEIAEAQRALGAQAEEVRTLFISVDPEQDTPERMRAYLQAFEVPVIGLTGTAEELQTVAAQYGASWDRIEDTSHVGYTVEHSARTYVLDRDGVVRWALTYEEGPEQLEEALRLALAAEATS